MLNVKRVLLTAFLLLLSVTSGGCRAERAGAPAMQPTTPAAAPPAGLGGLPRPSELRTSGPTDHRTSYTEKDLIYEGNDYASYLPSAHTSQSGRVALIQPQWSEANGKTFANLGYCMYQFFASGYDRAPEVHYGWEQAPTDLGTVWVGLAHFEKDAWMWFEGNPEGEVAVPSFDPYQNLYGDLIVVIVIASDEDCQLRFVRLGPIGPEAVINVNNSTGLTPFVARFTAYGSKLGVGMWDEIAWDFTTDGTYDSSSTHDLTAQCTYGAVGGYTATLRMTNTYGEQDSASTDLTVKKAWRHSWGTDLSEHVRGVCVDGQRAVCAVGFIDDPAGDYLFLLRFDSEGNPLWARRWGGGEHDRGMSVFAGGGGALYVTGVTHSHDTDGGDVLIQRWNTEGDLEWTRTWGGAGLDEGVSIGTSDGDLYVLGNTTIDDDAGDVLLLRYEQDGTLVWARSLGGEGFDEGSDLRAFFNFAVQSTYLHVAGTTESLAPSHSGALYARVYADGSLGMVYVWADGTATYGNAVAVAGLLYGSPIYIAGVTDQPEKGYDSLLLEVSLEPDPLAMIWGGAGTEWITGLELVGENLVLTGQSNSSGSDGIPNCLLLSYSPDDGLQKAEVWIRNNTLTEQVNASAAYLDNGVVLAGLCSRNDAAAWHTVPAGQPIPEGSWQDMKSSANYHSPTGIESTPDEPALPITGGVLDEGGGEFDLLLTIRSTDKIN